MITKIKNFVRSLVGAEKKSKSTKSKKSSSTPGISCSVSSYGKEYIKEQFIEVESKSDLNKLTAIGPAVGVVLEPTTAWKAVEEGVVELKLPKGTKIVSSGIGYKLRCDRAEVKGVFGDCGLGNDYNYEMSQGTSFHDPSFVYSTGDTVTPTEPFDDNPAKTCSSGIHFYASKQLAKRHHERQSTVNRTRNGTRHTRARRSTRSIHRR